MNPETLFDIENLLELGFSGPDASLCESLGCYGFAYRQVKEAEQDQFSRGASPGDWQFVYRTRRIGRNLQRNLHGGSMRKTYRVRWEIDVEAGSVQEAAQKARQSQLRPDTLATVFEIRPWLRLAGVDYLPPKDTQVCATIDLLQRLVKRGTKHE